MQLARIAIFLLYAGFTSGVSSQPAEKLILGFEETELKKGAYISTEEKAGRESWFYLLEQSEGLILRLALSGPAKPIEPGHGIVGRESILKAIWRW